MSAVGKYLACAPQFMSPRAPTTRIASRLTYAKNSVVLFVRRLHYFLYSGDYVWVNDKKLRDYVCQHFKSSDFKDTKIKAIVKDLLVRLPNDQKLLKVRQELKEKKALEKENADALQRINEATTDAEKIIENAHKEGVRILGEAQKETETLRHETTQDVQLMLDEAKKTQQALIQNGTFEAKEQSKEILEKASREYTRILQAGTDEAKEQSKEILERANREYTRILQVGVSDAKEMSNDILEKAQLKSTQILREAQVWIGAEEQMIARHKAAAIIEVAQQNVNAILAQAKLPQKPLLTHLSVDGFGIKCRAREKRITLEEAQKSPDLATLKCKDGYVFAEKHTLKFIPYFEDLFKMSDKMKVGKVLQDGTKITSEIFEHHPSSTVNLLLDLVCEAKVNPDDSVDDFLRLFILTDELGFSILHRECMKALNDVFQNNCLALENALLNSDVVLSDHPLLEEYLMDQFTNQISKQLIQQKKLFTSFEVAVSNNPHSRRVMHLGWCYERGIGVDKSLKNAFELYRSYAEKGNCFAQYEMGRCLRYGIGVEPNLEQARSWLEIAASKGYGRAMRFLGDIYQEEAKIEKALQYYESAVANRDARALNELGDLYRLHKDFRDGKKAVDYYLKAIDQGDIDAQVGLGKCYENGVGVEMDKRKAFELYQKAVKLGNSWAYKCLGVCYQIGAGTTKDLEKAVEHFEIAEQLGQSVLDLANLQEELACNFGQGINGQQIDYTKAYVLYRKAAERGHSNAQYNMGICYLQGFGVQRDQDMAIYYFTLAESQGRKEASEVLKLLASAKK